MNYLISFIKRSNLEQVMQFAPVPEPTKIQLAEFGYLEGNDYSGDEKLSRLLPDAKTWADKLGINTSYELLSRIEYNISAEDYELVVKARKVILKYLERRADSMVEFNIRLLY